MKILHLLYAGHLGGIEKLCKDIGLYSTDDNIFCFVHEGGILCNEMKTAGLQVMELNANKKDIYGVYKRIRRICEDKNIDCVTIHHPAPLLWCSMCLLKVICPNTKVLLYVHSNYKDLIKGKKWKSFLYSKIVSKCDRIIAISESVKNSVIEGTYAVPAKIDVVYNGVACSNYFCERNTKFYSPVQILYVGRLIKQKGLQVLISALALFPKTANFELNIVGDGPYRTVLEKLTKLYGLNEKIHYQGSRYDIMPWLEKSDIFVHPAICEEGFGITLIEAMSAGLICVAFRKGAIPEIIENEVSGFIINEAKPKALATKLLTIMDHLQKDNMLQMRKNAEKHSACFLIENTVAKLSAIYRNA